MIPRHSLRFAVVAAAALAHLAPMAADARAAGKPVEIENIRVGFNDRFKVGAWTPVWVQVRGGAELFEGTMEIVADDESGVPTSYPLNVRIAAGEQTTLTSYTRSGLLMGDLVVRFRDRDGRPRATFRLNEVLPNKSIQPIFADEIMILALGRPAGVELIPTIPGLNGSKALSGNPTASTASVVEVVRLSGPDLKFLPGRSLGYDALDAVVVDTNDRLTMDALADKGDQLQAWVEHGGHLVVSVGTNWQMLRDHPIGRMLPATVAAPTEIKDFRTIESFAGAATQLQPENKSLLVARLGDVEAKASKALFVASNLPIVVRGVYGFGRVTVVGLDVDQAPFSTWADRARFWVKAIDLRNREGAGAGTRSARFINASYRDLAGTLRMRLDQFPGVKLVPFGWVAFFIFLYIVLIGPGDYFFLRKVVKRMEFTWFTFPAIVLIVSGAAYWAAYKIKGTELRVNQIDVVDIDVVNGLERGAAFVNVFSPRNHDYDVSVSPRPLREGGKTSNELERRVSWFAAPEFGPRGMSGGQGMSFGAGGYRYAPTNPPSMLEGVRIPIWSSKAFGARWFTRTEGAPVVDSTLAPSGIDRIVGTVTNRLDVPLRNCVIAYNSQLYYRLTTSHTIEPGETVRVELNPPRNFSTYLSELTPAVQPYYGPNTPSTNDATSRYDLMQLIMFHDSQTLLDIVPSRSLHDLDMTGLLQLDKPILIAEIDRPLSELNLGADAVPTRNSHTTILRVVLPIENPHAPKAGPR